MEVSDTRRLKHLEIEQAKLLRMLGQRGVDIQALKFLLLITSVARRPLEGRFAAETSLPGE